MRAAITLLVTTVVLNPLNFNCEGMLNSLSNLLSFNPGMQQMSLAKVNLTPVQQMENVGRHRGSGRGNPPSLYLLGSPSGEQQMLLSKVSRPKPKEPEQRRGDGRRELFEYVTQTNLAA